MDGGKIDSDPWNTPRNGLKISNHELQIAEQTKKVCHVKNLYLTIEIRMQCFTHHFKTVTLTIYDITNYIHSNEKVRIILTGTRPLHRPTILSCCTTFATMATMPAGLALQHKYDIVIKN